MRDLHPQHGGRVLLELEGGEAAGVLYRVGLYVPEASWHGRAELADGDFRLGEWDGDGEPPEWLVKAAYAFLRSLYNARRGPDAPPWPRRLLRWRAG
ncbi:MAG: hypothetical protein ACOCXM_02375 [Myxococcota bacterium]